MIRPPAVAGQFYPGQAQQLRTQVQQLLAHGARTPVRALGVISPHAGYIYSGRVAGETFAGVVVPERVVVLGPNHHGLGLPLAVSGATAWHTPLGDVVIDETLRQALLTAVPELVVDDAAHRPEHSLEVQLPFLQQRQNQLKILPICIGPLPLETLQSFGRQLGRVLIELGEPCLLVASSDMTHYESAEAAQEKDFSALEKVLQLDAEGLYRQVLGQRISMCGVLPSVIMLAAVRELGATSARLVRYTNSGEVTGDTSEVVGYAGVIVS